MYNVLLLDDLFQERNSLEELLIENGMKVYSCDTASGAEEIWDEHKNKIDAIVLDLMMPVDYGIERTLFSETDGGSFTGWVWLWKVLNPDNTEPHPTTGKYIVVCSAYIEKLKEHIQNKKNPKEDEFCKTITFINKGSKKDSEVLNALKINRRNKKF